MNFLFFNRIMSLIPLFTAKDKLKEEINFKWKKNLYRKKRKKFCGGKKKNSHVNKEIG